MDSIKKFITHIIDRVNNHAENFGNPYVAFGIFGVITYPLYYLIWNFTYSQSYENLSLRLIAAALCLPLIFKNKWPPFLFRFLPLYWYLTLLYSLPFLFTFLLLKNNFSCTWVLNTMTVLVLCILLLDLTALLIVVPLGIVLGLLCYHLTTEGTQLPANYQAITLTYLSVIVFGALFAHRKKLLQEEKLQTMRSIGASIAHELRTPLATLSTGVSNFKKYFPSLIQAYNLANKAGLAVPKFRPRTFALLEELPDALEAETQAAFTFIEMLLMNVNPALDQESDTLFGMSKSITEALSRYPFKTNQRELILWDPTEDFLVQGKKILLIHVLFNLIKNALYYIAKAHKGNIKIWLELGMPWNKLYFEDGGTGISPEVLPHIFDRFFTKTHHGAGIGLTFCKMVMQEGFSGNIVCESMEGSYTRFILSFPRILTP